MTIAGLLLVGPVAETLQDGLAERQMRQDADRILELIGDSDALTFHQRVDRVRRFVNLNSEHRIDEEFWSYNHDWPRVVQMLLAHADGAGKQPHLECFSRSKSMAAILDRLDIRSRLVHIYEPAENYPSHTFLEVFNPTTRSWEIQDADFDLFYVDALDGRRLSTEMMLSQPLDSVRPCQSPEKCGWDIGSREDIMAQVLRRYFNLAVIRASSRLRLVVNPERFDLDEPRLVNGKMLSFCEHDPGLCSRPTERVGGV